MPSAFRVIHARLEDLTLALQAISEVHERPLLDDKAIENFLRDRACLLLLAVDGDRVLGSLNGYRLPNPHRRKAQFLLYEIDVRPECRRQGIGKALVNAFIAEAAKEGSTEVWVVANESNEAAMKLYQSCGFLRKNHDDVMLEYAIQR